MEELFGTYYGLDWVAMITSFLFMYYIGNKKRIGFLYGLMAAGAWIYTNTIAHLWAGVLLNVILIGLHVRGYLKWGKANSNTKNETK